ncbi:MAG: GNAT family N-acetyltransferase, partial [Verrucomicrobia bacterium]|nr:GNAT family N-acetyltransferase [Verrucomicrobiota bacterium]
HDHRAWDVFLESTPLGHFQQSSAWARVKAEDGWETLRVLVREEDGGAIRAGFQILKKRTRVGGVAYISKGPVIPAGPLEEELRAFVTEQVVSCVRDHGIAALIAQPPDDDVATTPSLSRLGFSALGLSMVIESTLVVDLAKKDPEWRKDLRKTTANQVRKAVKKGVTVRVATAADLPVFFDLMSETCRRQNTSPSPASLSAVERLWAAFHDRGMLRISFAEFESQPLATVLLLKFGERVTLWKKGWNSKLPNHHPNDLVNHEAMEWSERVGARFFDFAAMDPDITRSVLANEPLRPDQMATRYFFLMGFGGSPRMLPPAQIYLRNPILRRMFPVVRPALVAFERWKDRRAQRRK